MIGIGRAYAVTFTAVSVSAAQELFYIKPASEKPCTLESVTLSNVGGTADAGDAQEELLDIRVIRLPATVTASSGGTAPTPTPHMASDTAAGFTARVNDTTLATTTGTATTLIADGFNVRVGWQYIPIPEDRLVWTSSFAMVVRLQTAPADAVSLSGTAIVREMG